MNKFVVPCYKFLDTKWGLVLFAFLSPFFMNVWQYLASDCGSNLLSVYLFSDAGLFHYSAWFKATFSVNSYVSNIIALSPYERLLTASITAFGHSNTAPFILNAVLSGLCCICVCFTTRGLFGTRAAYCSIVIYTFCAPILFFSGSAHKTQLILLLLSITNLCVMAFFKRQHLWLLGLFSVVILVASIDRIHALWALLALLITLRVFRKSLSNNHYLALKASSVVIVIMVAWATLSATLFGAEPRYYSSVGLNVYMGHTKPDNFLLEVPNIKNDMLGHRSDPRKVAEKAVGRALSQSEVTAFWVDKTFDYIWANPGDYVVSQLQKLHHLFARVSSSVASERLGVWRSERAPLHIAWFDFGSVFALSCGALIILWRRGLMTLTAGYLVIGGLGYLLSIMLTVVLERYRMGVLIFMIPLASFSLVKISSAVRSNIPALIMVVAVYCASHMLMLTAPANYANPEFNAGSRAKAVSLREQGAKQFYELRASIDRDGLNQEHCLRLISELKRVKHSLDINRVKIACSDVKG